MCLFVCLCMFMCVFMLHVCVLFVVVVNFTQRGNLNKGIVFVLSGTCLCSGLSSCSYFPQRWTLVMMWMPNKPVLSHFNLSDHDHDSNRKPTKADFFKKWKYWFPEQITCIKEIMLNLLSKYQRPRILEQGLQFKEYLPEDCLMHE